jgi:subtilisin family serine protease
MMRILVILGLIFTFLGMMAASGIDTDTAEQSGRPGVHNSEQPKVKKMPRSVGPTAAKVIDNEIIIKFKEQFLPPKEALERRQKILQENAQNLRQTFRASLVAIYPEFGWIRLKLPSESSFMEIKKALEQDKRIEYARPNYEITLHTHHSPPPPNDRLWIEHFSGDYSNPYPSHSYLWGLDKIGMKETWDLISQREAVTAIVDTGIDFGHPDLLVNNFGGISFCGEASTPVDDHGHGTYVAGIIAAQSNNWVSRIDKQPEAFLGVNPRSRLIAVKISCPLPNITDAIAGIHSAITMGATVINGSWGFYGLPADDPTVVDLKTEIMAGVNTTLYVASAGNEVRDFDICPEPTIWPQMFQLDNVIVVAATNPDDTLWVSTPPRWDSSPPADPCLPDNRPDKPGRLPNDPPPEGSNLGIGAVHIGAPGENIWSTMPVAQFDSSEDPLLNAVLVASSTSGAAPFVAGCASLLQNERLASTPLSPLLPHDLKVILMNTGDSISAKIQSARRLNCYKALQEVKSTTIPPIVPTNLRVN